MDWTSRDQRKVDLYIYKYSKELAKDLTLKINESSKVQHNSEINALLCIQRTIRLDQLKQWFNIWKFNTSEVDCFLLESHTYI